MLIQTAGYMWSRWHVDWTSRKLLGEPEEGEGGEVDFADQSGIYGLFNTDHECVYVGQWYYQTTEYEELKRLKRTPLRSR